MTDNIPAVISRFVLHPDGTQEIPYISPRVEEVFELDPEAMKADVNELWKRIHPDDVEAVEREVRRSAETLERKGTRWVEAWSLPSLLDNGDIAWDGIVLDVTDLGQLDSFCLLYTSPSPRDATLSRMPSSA